MESSIDLRGNDLHENKCVPAAFLSAVNLLEFTTALTPPDRSSSTMVVPGRPFSLTSFGASAEGTETTLMVVPADDMRDGMNSVVWCSMGIAVLCGWWMPRCRSESLEKTSAMSATSSSGVNLAVTFATSAAERTRRDMLSTSDPSSRQKGK